MGKSLYIAEKPSVAQEFAKALHVNSVRKDGYLESEDSVVTWCVGHLVTMSYPEVYDEKYKRWSLATLPFIPEKFLYEVIPSCEKAVSDRQRPSETGRTWTRSMSVLTPGGRENTSTAWWSRWPESKARNGRESGSIRRRRRRSFTGIRDSEGSCPSTTIWPSSAYLRAKEDYLMGINFSRLLSLKYGNAISNYLRNALYRDLRGPGYDLRAGHGGPPGMGDPEFRENALLPRGSYTEPRRWKGVSGRISGSSGL